MSILYNENAEANLLGILIVDNDKFTDILDLKADEFYTDKHKILYSAMKALYSKGQKFDEVVLCTQLPREDLERIGGITYIMNLSQAVTTTRTACQYAKIIKENALKRDILGKCRLMEKNIENKSVEELEADLEEEINKINNAVTLDSGSFKEELGNLVLKVEDRYKGGGIITGISTGYKLMDKALNGLNPGDFIILAARPSMGKTTLAENIFLNIAMKENKAAAFFSLEMTKEQLLAKAISNLSLIEHGRLIRGKLKEEEFIKLINASNRLEGGENIRIFDLINSISGIRAECKKLKMQNKLEAVFIDYLQLIRTNEKFQNTNAEVSYISAELKQLAKELNVPVVCLSQLSRAVESRFDHTPRLSDLRDSGSIEQDADIIMFLYRDEYYNRDSEERNVVRILVEKNRQGETCQFKLAWKPEYCRVAD